LSGFNYFGYGQDVLPMLTALSRQMFVAACKDGDVGYDFKVW